MRKDSDAAHLFYKRLASFLFVYFYTHYVSLKSKEKYLQKVADLKQWPAEVNNFKFAKYADLNSPVKNYYNYIVSCTFYGIRSTHERIHTSSPAASWHISIPPIMVLNLIGATGITMITTVNTFTTP